MNETALDRLYFLVVNNGNLDTIRELLSKIHDVDVKFQIVSSLLLVAAISTLDNIMIVRELIHLGANANMANYYGLTPLHYAVLRRNHNVVDALIVSGANINAKSRLKRTSLHFAISNYKFDKRKRTSLSRSSGPDTWVIEKLLNQENIVINKGDINGDTPLIWAVRHKQLNTVLLLLEKGANPHIGNQDRETSLHFALYDKDPSLVILVQLLKHRASLNCVDRKRKTPVDILIQNIGNTLTFQDACTFLKVVALHYSMKKPLIRKLKTNLQLWSYFKNCCYHVRRMRSDNIANKMTVFDFVMKCFNESDFDNPVIQVYKPIVERLLAGLYLKYLNLVLLRVSKSNLFAVLKIALLKYCKTIPKTPNCEETIDIIDHKELSDVNVRQEMTDTVGCQEMTDVKECEEFPNSKDSKDTTNANNCKDTTDAKNCPNINLIKVFLINLPSQYLSSLDVFHLIATFSSDKVSELSERNYN